MRNVKARHVQRGITCALARQTAATVGVNGRPSHPGVRLSAWEHLKRCPRQECRDAHLRWLALDLKRTRRRRRKKSRRT